MTADYNKKIGLGRRGAPPQTPLFSSIPTMVLSFRAKRGISFSFKVESVEFRAVLKCGVTKNSYLCSVIKKSKLQKSIVKFIEEGEIAVMAKVEGPIRVDSFYSW